MQCERCGEESGERRWCGDSCHQAAWRAQQRLAAELGKAVRVVTDAGLVVSAPESVPVHSTRGGASW